ncbi:uncharacterized protein LOC143680600 [Tamandua tetradactyla]|uniref:uncharacterized protein LOC143680600 n=1 Tax=Tamandua tetradactyla TaxID=48850 RepID=UPI0040547419
MVRKPSCTVFGKAKFQDDSRCTGGPAVLSPSPAKWAPGPLGRLAGLNHAARRQLSPGTRSPFPRRPLSAVPSSGYAAAGSKHAAHCPSGTALPYTSIPDISSPLRQLQPLQTISSTYSPRVSLPARLTDDEAVGAPAGPGCSPGGGHQMPPSHKMPGHAGWARSRQVGQLRLLHLIRKVLFIFHIKSQKFLKRALRGLGPNWPLPEPGGGGRWTALEVSSAGVTNFPDEEIPPRHSGVTCPGFTATPRLQPSSTSSVAS